MGISPPDKSPQGQKTPQDKNPLGQKVAREKVRRTKIPPAPDTQQAATYSTAVVAGNWTILVTLVTALLP